MTTYAFEVMSQAQAASFKASDSLVIGGVSATSANVTLAFSGSEVAITSAGRTLTFGAAFTSQVRSLQPAGDGAIIVGTNAGEFLVGPTYRVGGLVPLPNQSADAIYAGGGDDTLSGGDEQGPDTLSGGAGSDVFVFWRAPGADVVADFTAADRLAFDATLPTAGNYVETTAGTELAALQFATAEIQQGRAHVVVAQVGADLLVYVEDQETNRPIGKVTLRGADLSAIDHTNFVAYPGLIPAAVAPPPAVDAPPPLIPTRSAIPQAVAPTPPTFLTVNQKGDAVIIGNMDLVHFSDLAGARVDAATSTRYAVAGPKLSLLVEGSGFRYDAHQVFTTGQTGHYNFQLADGSLSAVMTMRNGVVTTAYSYWVETDATQAAFAQILGGADSILGGAGADLLRSHGGDDLIVGRGGGDTLYGGAGNDIIYAEAPGGADPSTASTYLRGDEDNDFIIGGRGFDDINGNQGRDTATGGAGDDWVVGGKDLDLLFGDGGADLVYGNIGDDICDGGDGNDTVRGGQDNDVLRGGAGADFLSGDRGSDTVSGGGGADIFHTFGETGLDRVTDFDFADGDRVQLAPGTQYTVTQSGPDVVITMAGGGQMLLLDVSLATLSPGWIFGA